ncbi:MAG: hypothetical protein JRI68_21875, partial [Deltaproteobacteria bacterium]|nr:hypothetical protein [Deltaproteobacteria bacterium]
MRFVCFICASLVAAGCNAMFGVDDLTFGAGSDHSTGGTTATGGGGSGGTGGTASGSGGASTGGGGVTGPCGTFALLADDFEDQTVGPDWEELTAGSTISEDGQLVVQVGTGTGAQYGAIRSSYTYDLRDSAVYVTVDQTLATGNTYLQLSVVGEGALTLRRMGDSLVVVRDINVVA